MHVLSHDGPPVEGAGVQARLVAVALDVVHPDWPRALAKGGAARGARGPCCKAELTADDVRIGQAEVVIRDGAPDAIVVDLETAFARASATNEAHQALSPWH